MFQIAPPSLFQMDDFTRNTWTKSTGLSGRFQLERVDDFIGIHNAGSSGKIKGWNDPALLISKPLGGDHA